MIQIAKSFLTHSLNMMTTTASYLMTKNKLYSDGLISRTQVAIMKRMTYPMLSISVTASMADKITFKSKSLEKGPLLQPAL